MHIRFQLHPQVGSQRVSHARSLTDLATLHGVDYHSVASTACTSPRDGWTPWSTAFFTRAHVMILTSAKYSLQTLCIAGNIEGHSVAQYLHHALPTVATFTQLTKLHLSFFQGQPDFSCLGQLKRLENLALQCSEGIATCHQVILSNRSSLRYITLAAAEWADAAYAAISNLQSVQQLVLKVMILSHASAGVIGNMQLQAETHIMIMQCTTVPASAFHALSRGSANITQL